MRIWNWRRRSWISSRGSSEVLYCKACNAVCTSLRLRWRSFSTSGSLIRRQQRERDRGKARKPLRNDIEQFLTQRLRQGLSPETSSQVGLRIGPRAGRVEEMLFIPPRFFGRDSRLELSETWLAHTKPAMLELLSTIPEHVEPFPFITGINPVGFGQHRCVTRRQDHSEVGLWDLRMVRSANGSN